jgi:hypothetical protein
MASHTEIKVGDSNWVIRVAGADVQVKVLEKIKKASGRGWEFRCKRFQNGRSVGRNLTRGSGAFRRPGEPTKTTGFSKKPRTPARKPRAARRAPAPAPAAPAYQSNPPASAFFSEIQEPGKARPSSRQPASTRLGSLRGRGRTKSSASAPARAASSPTPSAARREIEKLLKQAGLTPVITDLVKALVNSDGSMFTAEQVYARVMADHRMRSFGGAPFRR